jgi:hypothetical protein
MLVVQLIGRFAGKTIDMPADVAKAQVRSGHAKWPEDALEAGGSKPGGVENISDDVPAEVVPIADVSDDAPPMPEPAPVDVPVAPATYDASAAPPRRRGRPPGSGRRHAPA